MPPLAEPLAAYEALSPALRKLVQVTAVYGEHIYLTNLKMLMKELGWRDDQERLLYNSINTDLSARLLKAGIWVEEHASIRCHPTLVEPLTEAVREQGRLEAIIRAVDTVMPYRPSAFGIPDREAQRRFLREIRFAMLRDDGHQVFRIMGMSQPSYLQVNSQFAADLRRIYGGRLERASPEIQFMALDPLLDEGEMQLSDQRSVYERFETLFGELAAPSPVLVQSLFGRRLMRGAFDELGKGAASGSVISTLSLGVQAFARGEDLAAIARFQEVVAHLKKQQRKRSIHIPRLEGVFHLLALLRQGSPTSMAQLKIQLDAAHRPLLADPFQAAFEILSLTQTVIQEGQGFDETHPYLTLRYTRNPWVALIPDLPESEIFSRATP